MYISFDIMTTLWIRRCLSLLLIFVTIGCQDSDSKEVIGTAVTPIMCDPGSTSDAGDNCNTCTCPESGLVNGLICTQMTCDIYNPCQDKSCGDPCQICNATDTECQESAELKVCSLDGQCIVDGALSCDSDLCANVECGESSPSSCDGNAVIPAQVAMCDPETGECLSNNETIGQDCTATGQICRDGTCIALGDNDCFPGDTFDAGDECNTCECPNSGLKSEAICSEIICQEESDFIAQAGSWSYRSFVAGVASCEGVKDDIASALSEDKGFVLSDVIMMSLNWSIDGLPEAANCALNERDITCNALSGNVDNDYGLILPTVIDISGRFDDALNLSGTYTANINCEGDLCVTIELLYSISFPCQFDFNFVAGAE